MIFVSSDYEEYLPSLDSPMLNPNTRLKIAMRELKGTVGDRGGGGSAIAPSPLPLPANTFFCFGGAAGRQLDVCQTFAVKN